MIWRIFKKDLQLFWPYAALFAALQFGYVVMLWLDPLIQGKYSTGEAAAILLRGAMLLSGGFLIAFIAHADPIPGTRQDWLTRPIPRSKLLMAKLLSVVLMIHLPVFVAEMIYDVVGNGFPVAASFEAALTRAGFLFLVLSLPILAFASLMKNAMEVIAGAVAVALGYVAFLTLTQSFHWELLMLQQVPESAFAWEPLSAGYLAVLAGSISVLSLQYLRRKTVMGRSVAVLVCLAYFVVTSLFPWNPAFAFQQRLSQEPGAGSTVRFSFEPGLGRYPRPQGVTDRTDWGLYIPVLVEGLPAGTVLRADLSYAESVDFNGDRKPLSFDVNQDSWNGEGDRHFDFLGNGPGHLRAALQPITGMAAESPWNNPALKEQPFQLDITLFLTLFRSTQVTDPQPLSHMQAFGSRCAHHSWMTQGGTFDDQLAAKVEFYCTPVLNPPTCLTMIIEAVPLPYVLKPILHCRQDYRPYRGQLLPGGEDISAVALLRDPAGHVQPNDGLENLHKSRAILRGYEPVDHFVRKLSIPGVRMQDWKSE